MHRWNVESGLQVQDTIDCTGNYRLESVVVMSLTKARCEEKSHRLGGHRQFGFAVQGASEQFGIVYTS